MIERLFDWLANHNFFNKPTFIRKVQCNIFGHHSRTVLSRRGERPAWCAWCARPLPDGARIRTTLEDLTKWRERR